MEESSVENAPKEWRKSLDYWRTRSSKLDYEKKEREKLKVEYDKLKEENKRLLEQLSLPQYDSGHKHK